MGTCVTVNVVVKAPRQSVAVARYTPSLSLPPLSFLYSVRLTLNSKGFQSLQAFNFRMPEGVVGFDSRLVFVLESKLFFRLLLPPLPSS